MKNIKSVLLIEDDKDDQEFFTDALKEIKGAVLYNIAENGQEAINLLAASASYPDLIFTDINMPVMNGEEYLSQAINIPGVCNIPVVVLSSDSGKAKAMSQLGARGFITKTPDY